MTAEQEVLAAEAARAGALVRRDLDALGQWLDEGLVYVHATGVRHDRPQLLAYVQSGPRFLEVKLAPALVRVHGDVALVSGDLHLHLQRGDDAPLQARSLVTAAWVRRDGRWKLAAFQSTRPG